MEQSKQPKTKNRFFEDKKVEMSELFFDLIFVYAISKIAHTILHIGHGVVSGELFVKFFIMTVIMTNIWTYQTFHTNRFGMVRPKDIGFLAFNMFIVIYLSNSLNPDFDETFFPFALCSAILYLSIAAQYIINYFETTGEDRAVCRIFALSSLTASLISFVALIVPPEFHYHFFFTAIAIAIFGPALGYRTLSASPVNISHLIERYSLLTIILFGEVMIGLASVFSIQSFDWMSIVQFLVVALLFWTYWLALENFFDRQQKTAGIFLYFAHVMLFLGLLMFNAAMVLSENHNIDAVFKVNLMYAALLAIYGGIFLNMPHFKQSYQSSQLVLYTMIIIIASFFISLFIPQHITWMALVTVGLVFILFNRKCSEQ